VRWDLVVVGAGPAGSATALAALQADPALRVLLLDRCDFPRDKACGDGVAPHVLDVLAGVGVTGLLDDLPALRLLELRAGAGSVTRRMRREARVVPRSVLDARLVQRAVASGAELRRHRVREVRTDGAGVELDGELRARVLVGADGAHSVVRRAVGLPPARQRALAVRGYAPTRPEHRGRQVIVFGDDAQPAYAWAFDRGDGLANVGYGQLLRPGRPAPPRPVLVARAEQLLPGATRGGTGWRGHPLPLSSARWTSPDGPVLLAGDAAGLVNPLTGEGLYYAVATGVLAGRAAAAAAHGEPADARDPGRGYRRAVRSRLGVHLGHTAAASRLLAVPGVIRAAVGASAADQGVFDDLVEVGLGAGRVTPRVAAGLARALVLSGDLRP